MINKKYISQPIKHIIFDLGGVIINIDYHKTINAFIELGISDFNKVFSQASQQEIFDKLDIGNISGEDFTDEITRLLPKNISKKQIIDAWNAMLLDIPTERISLLKSLKGKYSLFLLSNTNTIHLPVFEKQLLDQEGVSLHDLFDKVYYSFEIGIRKPNKEAFTLILNENNIKAEDTLFIDDSIQHIEAAKQLGINTYHLHDQDVCSLFKQ